MKQNSSNLNSVEKAIAILQAFQADHPVWGVRELAARLGFSPATVQRILQTLKLHGFVEQDDQTRQYRLGSVYYRFIAVLESDQPLPRAARSFMQALLEATRETVHLNVIDGTDRVCIDHMESPQELKAIMPIGNRSPLHAGASAKCLLAFSSAAFIERYLGRPGLETLTDQTVTDAVGLKKELDRIRRQGYAASLGERIAGLGALSAPVLDYRGSLLAAISLALPEIRYRDPIHRKFCIAALLKATRDFSKHMGYSG
ncbi:IclR family transcriptional regulator [Desulfococcus multivorans]|uniref:Transcriptional regulator, IclR family n=2 Tax=Desulfococcus TaxID=896 RepID=S7VJA0_DESML|nr:IclR family transcriptional regulator [Desulfococcus multivorans]AQV03116.1 IclR family transcriptional regulator [Desulfococcus multivorans]EPR44648.1 transcriptional regulator, IclR family [Desulfococcus multivorans DSM 2059]MDX9818977.1 IclR family transcriptional regulator [Desulfococcus multivorans]SKA07854.1 transcriptional regulator, IclR family [Desulfococcus multivorans DSM 2059]